MKEHLLLITSIAILWLCSLSAYAQTPGALDTTIFRVENQRFNDVVRVIVQQPDGKIIVGGDFTSYNGVALNRIARLNADGTIDNSFNVGTGFDNTVTSMVLQPDNKIIIGGGFTSYHGITSRGIARLHADGTLDNSFIVGTGLKNIFNYAINIPDMKIQADGKIIVGGNFSSYNGVARTGIARLNTDGTLDNSFITTGTGFVNSIYGVTIYSIVLQTDGKIVVGGTFTHYNGIARRHIARLNTNGTLDNSFTVGTGFSTNSSCVASKK